MACCSRKFKDDEFASNIMRGYVFGKMDLRNHAKEGVGSHFKNE